MARQPLQTTLLDTVDEEDIHGRKQLLQVLERESQMMSTQLDKTMDADDVGQRLSHEGDDDETAMNNTDFPKYDAGEKQRFQTMTNFKGPDRFAITNMNKTPQGKGEFKH